MNHAIHATNLIANGTARMLGILPWDNLQCDPTYYPTLVLLYKEFTDCDGTYCNGIEAIPATQEHLNAYINSFNESLEGPGNVRLITIEWAKGFIEDREEALNEG